MVGQLELVQVSSGLSRFVALKLKPPDRTDFLFVLFLVFLPLFSIFWHKKNSRGYRMTADFSWHRPYRAISQVAFSHFNWKKVFVFHFHRRKPGRRRRRSTTTNIDATTVTFSPFYKLLARPEQLALFTPGIGDQGLGGGRGGVDHARKNTPKIWNSSLRRAMKKKSILNSVWNFFSDPVAFLVLICISSPVRETASTAELRYNFIPRM